MSFRAVRSPEAPKITMVHGFKRWGLTTLVRSKPEVRNFAKRYRRLRLNFGFSAIGAYIH